MAARANFPTIGGKEPAMSRSKILGKIENLENVLAVATDQSDWETVRTAKMKIGALRKVLATSRSILAA